MKRLLLAVGAALALLIPIKAQAVQSITVTPTAIDKEVAAGTTIAGTTQVLNQAETAFNFNVYAAPYSVSGEDYDPSFVPIPGATNVASWIKLKAAKTRIEPYSLSDVNYQISVPAATKPGSYYGVIFAETESQVDGTGVVARKRVGTVMYIRVPGDVVQEGRVISWNVPWFQAPNLTQSIRIENTGTVHYAATIQTTIKDLFGSTKLTYKQQRNILPEKIRRVVIDWEKTPPLGIFKVSGSVTILDQVTPLPDRYVLVMSQSLRQILAVCALIIITIVAISMIRKRRRKPKA